MRSYHLFPHERWFANLVIKRQSVGTKSPAVLNLEKNNGPNGIMLMAAAIASSAPGAAIGFIGAILLVISNDRPPILTVAYYLMGIGVAIVLASMVRVIQGMREGRAFRRESSPK